LAFELVVEVAHLHAVLFLHFAQSLLAHGVEEVLREDALRGVGRECQPDELCYRLRRLAARGQRRQRRKYVLAGQSGGHVQAKEPG